MVIMILFAPQIFKFFLGGEWVISGKISQILIFWCFFSFIKPPAMMMFNILNLQKIQFRIEFIQLFSRIAALAVGYLIFESYLTSLALYVIVGIFFDIYTIFFIYNSILKNEKVSTVNPSHKVIFIISGLGQGGAERVLSTVANECAERGMDVEIISGYSNQSAYSLSNKIIVHYLGFNRLKSQNLVSVFLPLCKRILKVRYILNKTKPNVLISFGDATNVQSIISNKLLRYSSAKQIISIRSNPEKLNFLSKIATNIFYRLSNLLVVQTLFVEDWARKRFSNLKVKIINNPVAIPSKIYPEKTIDFLHVGTIKFEKNHKDLIRAFSIISNKIEKSSKLYLVGGIESKSLDNSIKNLINKYNIKDRVVFMGSQKNVDTFYGKSKIFILPSLYEGMSNALLEAMSHGLPSITTAYKGSSDIIKSGYNGIIVPKRDVKSLADAMLDLYLDENKRLRIGQNAKQTIVDDFKQDIVVSKWIKSIKEEL